jgi:hypothetical protein
MPLGINDTIKTQGQSHGELLEGPILYQKYKKMQEKSAPGTPPVQKN